MKIRKNIFVTSLLTIFLISNYIHGQQKSKNDLGNLLVESILNNDLESFKGSLLPKNVILELQLNEFDEAIDKEKKDSLLTEYEARYDQMIIPRFEKNFQEMVNLNQTNTIDWSNLNFVILYRDSSKGEEYIPFFMHTKLKGSDYNHFYFEAVRYKGEWFLQGALELTKEEKYAPR